MLDRWRLAIVFAAFSFVASAALLAHGSFTDLEVRWGWAINVVCPAHILITQLFPNVNSGTADMLWLWMAQTLGNMAIWFGAGALITKLVGNH